MPQIPSLFRLTTLAILLALCLPSIKAQQFLLGPEILSMESVSATELLVTAQVPAGYRHVVLEGNDGTESDTWTPLIAGPLSGDVTQVQFHVPVSTDTATFRITAGVAPEAPQGTLGSSKEFIEVTEGNGGNLIPKNQRPGHVLSRLAYGPSESDLLTINQQGLSKWITQQLNPNEIDESSNVDLQAHATRLFEKYIPDSGQIFLAAGEPWHYFKGIEEPPASWTSASYDDAPWLIGPTGIGYGDGDDETMLDDMPRNETQDGYLSVYARKRFQLDSLENLRNLFLEIDYDDGFVAYLNGQEVARANVQGTPPLFDATATEAGGSIDNDVQTLFDLTPHLDVLKPGENVLAIQGHNAGYYSSDFSLIPVLRTLEENPSPSLRSIKALQEWIQVRGIHSQRQLQTILGEFWENHFTTDYDKVADYLEDLDEFRNLESDVRKDQAQAEAAQMEWEEYEFFHENGLGYFGDLLLRSATSPSMNIYLDSVLNLKDAPNENYAREILELHTVGVDNRYSQADIEQLAKCFTGWTLRKIHPERRKTFPSSARDPETTASRSISSSTPIIDLGEDWHYFKGLSEPPATWTSAEFNPSTWLSGPTGIGYDDEDDNTVLEDMRNNYASVYLRKIFALPEDADNLVLEIDYDDAYVAYLNGIEISRSRGLVDQGTPPPFDTLSSQGHEARGMPDLIDLSPHAKHFIKEGDNVLAIQVHNTSLSSSDLSVLPRLLSIVYAEDSIDLTDPAGVWTFRFDPDQHNLDEKILFEGTPNELRIPADRQGKEGVQDAIDVIDALVAHPSTSEFIVIKLVNRFISDGITLETYQKRSAPDYLLEAVDQGIASWNSTERPGHIGTVLERLLDPVHQESAFWKEAANFAKVKSPIEFINSSYRALGASIVDDDLPRDLEDLGMDLFQRDDPDGYSELGLDWIDTLSVLERVRFCQALGNNLGLSSGNWDLDGLMDRQGISTAEGLIEYFNVLLFKGLLAEGQRNLFLRFANTDDDGKPSPLEELRTTQRRQRLQQTVALILSSPGFHFQ